MEFHLNFKLKIMFATCKFTNLQKYNSRGPVTLNGVPLATIQKVTISSYLVMNWIPPNWNYQDDLIYGSVNIINDGFASSVDYTLRK